jgi:mannose-6-phosphate isomerase-like protein (cupin superfamily)
MAHITDWETLKGRSASSFLFQGEPYGASLSFFANDPPPGGGPVLHRHPYEEVFFVQEGVATFTAGEESFEAIAGQVVVVPPNTPHKFTNTTEGRVIITSIHPNPRVIQENLE